MPSSISSSEVIPVAGEVLLRAGFVRLTAADRPGVAQPVPERDVPLRRSRTSSRTEELISILAREREKDPAEAALRSLGELAAPGIARYLGRNNLIETQVARRRAAARAIADAATLKSARLLAGLLSHGEAEVRALIAGALARIAGKDLGFKEDYWKGASFDAGKKAWEDWVKQNAK